MLEITGDLWKFHPSLPVCIPTNGVVRRSGELVMGAGIASEAVARCRRLGAVLGDLVSRLGNNAYYVPECNVISFPTKDDWREGADILLIIRSCRQVLAIAGERKMATIYLPRVGCGNGGLPWEFVRPRIAPILDDRFVAVAPRGSRN